MILAYLNLFMKQINLRFIVLSKFLYQNDLCLFSKENESNNKLLFMLAKNILNLKKMVFYY